MRRRRPGNVALWSATCGIYVRQVWTASAKCGDGYPQVWATESEKGVRQVWLRSDAHLGSIPNHEQRTGNPAFRCNSEGVRNLWT